MLTVNTSANPSGLHRKSRDGNEYRQKPATDFSLQLRRTDYLPAYYTTLEHLTGEDHYPVFLLGEQQEQRDQKRSMTQYVQVWSDNWARLSGVGEAKVNTGKLFTAQHQDVIIVERSRQAGRSSRAHSSHGPSRLGYP